MQFFPEGFPKPAGRHRGRWLAATEAPRFAPGSERVVNRQHAVS
jgi:hypothetical protein